MSFIIYIKFKFGAHTARNTVTFLITFKLNSIHCVHQLNCLQRREEGGYEYTKNKCRYESEHGMCTHVCRAVVRAELRMLSQHQRASTANTIDRRVFSVVEHREAWVRGF